MAPEIIRMTEPNPYTFQSDVYSFGIVLFEMATGELPYKHLNNKDQILYMVGRGYLKPDLNKVHKDIPKRFVKLIENCISFRSEQRPLFFEILTRLEDIQVKIPKIHRSISEPTLKINSFELIADDLLHADYK